MNKHPLPIQVIPYSKARPLIKVGDGIGCRGGHIVSRAIRMFRGGAYDLSHWATIIRDTKIGISRRVKVFEFIGAGPRESYLSEAYCKDHGKLLWIPMNCTEEQQERMIDMAADLETMGTKYDHKTTFGAIFSSVLPFDVEKFNCSEGGWHLWSGSGRVPARTNKKNVLIAPVPGDVPVWADAPEIYELDMSA